MTSPRFQTTSVSEHFHRHVKALEGATMKLSESPGDRLAAESISMSREALYQYVAGLEAKLGIERTIVLRF